MLKMTKYWKNFKDLHENEGIYYIHNWNSILWRFQLSLNWPYISYNSNQILEGYFNTNLQAEFKMNIKRQIDVGKSYIYSQLSFDTCVTAFQWRKESLFNNWYWISTCEKKKKHKTLTHISHLYKKFKTDHRLKCKTKAEKFCDIRRDCLDTRPKAWSINKNW